MGNSYVSQSESLVASLGMPSPRFRIGQLNRCIMGCFQGWLSLPQVFTSTMCTTRVLPVEQSQSLGFAFFWLVSSPVSQLST